jgi:hypothetical protein
VPGSGVSIVIWIRRILAAPLLLLSLVCLVGTVRIFSGNLPGSAVGEGVMAAFFAAVTGAGAGFVLRPDLRRMRTLSSARVRGWFFTNPFGQAVVLYTAAAVVMAAAPKASLFRASSPNASSPSFPPQAR